jgi:hypothetical protein
MEKLPMVFDWMKRSPFCCKTTTAIAMVLSQYPLDVVLNNMTAGFASESGEVTMEDVQMLLSMAALFADRVLAVGDFMPYQVSQAAPRDLEVEHRDFALKQPF